jgi:colanic acid/amylovoran biosynthesis protein
MKILIVNGHSMRNAGYTAMCRAVQDALAAGFAPQPVTFIWAVNHPGDHMAEANTRIVGSFCHWAKPDGRWSILRLIGLLWSSLVLVARARWRGRRSRVRYRWRALFDAYLEADLVASCPGNFLYSSGRFGLPFLLDLYSLAVAHWLGKPLYLLPQTIGPITRGHERWLLRWLLPMFRLICVRDSISLDLCRTIRPGLSTLRLCPDVAFAFQPSGETHHDLQHPDLAQHARPLLGVTIINWSEQCSHFHDQDAYEAAVAAAIHHFIVHYDGYAVLFAHVQGPTPQQDDRRALRRLSTRLEDLRSRIVVLDELNDPDDLVCAYRSLDVMLGTRLHSCILALTARVPVLAIEYQYKTTGVLHTVGLSAWSTPITAAQAEALCRRLDQLFADREHIRQHLDRVLPDLIRQCADTGARIASDFRGLCAQ